MFKLAQLLLVDLRADGGSHPQEREDGTVLAGDDLKTLHSLTTSEKMKRVSQQLVMGAKLRALRDVRGVYFCLPIQDAHVLCKNAKVSMYQYVPRKHGI